LYISKVQCVRENAKLKKKQMIVSESSEIVNIFSRLLMTNSLAVCEVHKTIC